MRNSYISDGFLKGFIQIIGIGLKIDSSAENDTDFQKFEFFVRESSKFLFKNQFLSKMVAFFIKKPIFEKNLIENCIYIRRFLIKTGKLQKFLLKNS